MEMEISTFLFTFHFRLTNNIYSLKYSVFDLGDHDMLSVSGLHVDLHGFLWLKKQKLLEHFGLWFCFLPSKNNV